jgi:predicted RNA methylase
MRRLLKRSVPQVARFGVAPPHVIDRMLALARVTAADTLFDVGCGDGAIVIRAAQRIGCHSVGVELAPDLVDIARRNAADVAHLARFVCADVREVDLTPATVVTLYFGDAGKRLVRPILQTRLRPGTRVVSYNFDMGD